MVYKCEDCDKVSKTKKSLQQHMKLKHLNNESLQCAQCDKHFLNKYSLNQHFRRVHPSKLHSCTFCGSSFKIKSLRDQHITSVHTLEKSFQCKICPSKFSTADGLRAHQLVHTDDRPHVCNLCTKHFKSIRELKQHLKIVHTTRIKEFGCTECKKAFFTKSDLLRHQNIHKINREGFPECYFCHKKFLRPSDLVDHIRIHTQEQPFFCDEKLCKYASSQISNVKRHKLRKHSSTSTSNRVANGRIWKCYFCSKSCGPFFALTTHMRRHTKEVPFKCNFCKKKYISQNSLILHISTHTNEKAFKCSLCYNEFKTNGHLKKHMVTHTKEKRYFCQFCSYGSYFKLNFNRHLLKRHNNA